MGIGVPLTYATRRSSLVLDVTFLASSLRRPSDWFTYTFQAKSAVQYMRTPLHEKSHHREWIASWCSRLLVSSPTGAAAAGDCDRCQFAQTCRSLCVCVCALCARFFCYFCCWIYLRSALPFDLLFWLCELKAHSATKELINIQTNFRADGCLEYHAMHSVLCALCVPCAVWCLVCVLLLLLL